MDEHDRIINWLTRRTADEMEVAAAEAITKLRAELAECRRALKVIHTWASMHDHPQTRGSLVPSHVVDLCDKALAAKGKK